MLLHLGASFWHYPKGAAAGRAERGTDTAAAAFVLAFQSYFTQKQRKNTTVVNIWLTFSFSGGLFLSL